MGSKIVNLTMKIQKLDLFHLFKLVLHKDYLNNNLTVKLSGQPWLKLKETKMITNSQKPSDQVISKAGQAPEEET